MGRSVYYTARGNDLISGSFFDGVDLALGFWFTLSRRMGLVGYRIYQPAGSHPAHYAMIWSTPDQDTRPTVPIWWGMPSTAQMLKSTPAEGWRNYYVRPTAVLMGDVLMQFVVNFNGMSTKTVIDGLELDLVSDPITVLGGSNNPIGGGVWDPQLDVNNPPNNRTANLYGVDLILRDPTGTF